MTWILYNISTGTVLETDPNEPTGYSPDKAPAQVSFEFLPSQPLYLFKYSDSEIVPNSEANIKLFSPFQMSDVTSVPNKTFLDSIVDPVIGQVVYTQNMDISFRYNGTKWKQCGETAIYRGGLISGKLYVNELEVS